MNMLRSKFVFVILVLQLVTAGYTDDDYDDEATGKVDCKGKGKGCRSKTRKTDDDSGEEATGKVDCKGKGSGCRSKTRKTDDDYDDGLDNFDDIYLLVENDDEVPLKSQKNKLHGGSCNVCGRAHSEAGRGRVINGRPVQPVYKYPWIVTLIIGNRIMCGGALISANFVMTAGHCVFNKQMLRLPQCRGARLGRNCFLPPNIIRVGLLVSPQRTPSETMAVSRVIGNPRYNFVKSMYDVALLQLARPVRCSAFLMPICLPPRDFGRLGNWLITAGYGHNTPEGLVGPKILREGLVREIDPRRCALQIQPPSFVNDIVCAAGLESGQSSCYGDSGSALFGRFDNKFYAVGVVSYGRTPVCGPLNPVTFSKVSSALPFIRQHVRDLPR